MSDRFVVDPPQLDLLLKQLRLPTMRALWRSFTERADREGWPSARLLAALASHEVTDRERRRFERHRAEAKLPPGKTLANFDFTLVPAVSKARVRVLASGDVWLGEGANALLFGPPGTGKSHLAAGLGLALVENGFRVLCQRTANLVQKLQAARRDLALEAAIRKLHKYHLVILDDFSYVTCEQAETSVLFELIGARYEKPLAPGDRQRAVQRLGQDLQQRRHDRRRRRPPRPPLPHLRTQRRELPPPGGLRGQAGCGREAGWEAPGGPDGAGLKRVAGVWSGPLKRAGSRRKRPLSGPYGRPGVSRETFGTL